jgi:bifunctional non-homologous end joining protein LigD
MVLQEYARKRDFLRTPEPKPGKKVRSSTNSGRFFIQRHDASRLHYDFRLEIDGTLKSWAVPKGPSLDPGTKRLAAMVEDHPLTYGDFEGNIPKGNYGAGSVMLWDRGTFELIGEESGVAQLARGDLKFWLSGEKLHGSWALVHMKSRGKGNEWLLIKKKDEAADASWDIDKVAWSVKTGRTQQEIASDAAAKLTVDPVDPAKLPGAAQVPMPGFITPMAASLADEVPRGDEWILEIKWDGVRGLAYLDGGKLAIYTRTGIRCEGQYPELKHLPDYTEAKQAVLDGEIVVLDEKGISKFELIQPRIHTQNQADIARMSRENPVQYVVFDLLYLDGYDLRRVPLIERKRALAAIVKASIVNTSLRIRVSDHFENAGEDVLEAARNMGLEGLIAKRSSSKYVSRRSQDWLKLKLVSQEEFVIVGYTTMERDPFGSLALATRDRGKLVYVGNVGTGFNEESLRGLWARLQPLVIPKTPLNGIAKVPRGTVWVKPELVAQIKFANWTADKRLRAPVYLGLRNDKEAAAVTREKSVGFLPPDKKEVTINIDGHAIRFTNLDKVYYPEDGFAKRDLLNYYDAVAPLILPYLKDRPLTLKRYPNGIHEKFFFQKHTPESYPTWLRTETIGEKGKPIRYALVQDRASLLYLTNLGCIDQNPWMSRVGSLDHPDFVLLDLDPFHCEFQKVVEAALLVKEKLDAIGLRGYPKTTGGDGLHIYVPIEPHYEYKQARSFAEVMARKLGAERPDLFTTPRSVAEREKNRVYFDYLQIAESKTISAPYVARAYPGAPVATPLAWEELTPRLHPSQFNIANAPERFARVGDLFADVLKRPQKLEKAIKKLTGR